MTPFTAREGVGLGSGSAGKVAMGAVIVALAAGNLYQYTFLSRRKGVTPPLEVAPPEASPPSRDEVIRQFHELSYRDLKTWRENRWLGIHTEQNPNDVWVTQEILHEVRPDFVVETGTRFGGSAALWATLLQQINPQARVITIDIEDQVTDARRLPVVQRSVDFLVGSSTAPEIVAQVQQRVKGKRTVVILDSDHSRDHVFKEMQLYAPIVSTGSYLIVQDTNVNGHPMLPAFGPGPWEAVEAFLPDHPEFQVDSTRERLLFTMHPRGYLKRVR